MFRLSMILAALLAFSAFSAPAWAQEAESAPAAPVAEASAPVVQADGAADVDVSSQDGVAENTEDPDVEATAHDKNVKLPTGIANYRAELVSSPGRWKETDHRIDPNYLMRRGDKLRVSFTGSYNYASGEVEIESDGYVRFPDVDVAVRLDGKSWERVYDAVLNAFRDIGEAALNEEHIRRGLTRYAVEAVNIQGARIFVFGNGITPGEHVFSSTSVPLMHALNSISLSVERATMRGITVAIPDNKPISVDLYTENALNDIMLTDGARIEIPARGPVVTVTGAVKREVRVELASAAESWLTVLEQYAGGFAAGADTRQIQLVRHPINASTKTLFFSHDNPPPLMDGDHIHVRSAARDWRKPEVNISGAGVVQGDRRDISEHPLTLGELAGLAGLQPDAHDTILVERTHKDRSIERFEFTLADASFRLEPMDEVLVRSVHDLRGGTRTVKLRGSVEKPGAYPLSDGLRLDHLLRLEGSTIYNARVRDQVYTIWLWRTDSSTTETRARRIDFARLLANPDDALNNPLLAPNDEIVVAGKSAFESGMISVHVYGSVQNPKHYSLPDSLMLDGLVYEAGGLAADAAYPIRVSVLTARATTDEDSTMAEVRATIVEGPDDFRRIALAHNTIALIEPVHQYESITRVHVSGQVVQSGEFLLPWKNPTLAALLDSAGVRQTADVSAIRLERNNTRVVLTEDPRKSGFVLRTGDKVTVPGITGIVTIRSGVENPMTFAWERGKTLPYYAKRANGYAEQAHPRSAYAILPNGTYLKLHRFWFIKDWWREVPRNAVVDMRNKKEKPKKDGLQ